MRGLNNFGIIVCGLLAAAMTIVTVDGTNVLVFAPMPFKSHFRGFQPLFKELVRRGYNLTVVSAFPLKTPVENYTDIPITVEDSILQGPFTNTLYIFFFVSQSIRFSEFSAAEKRNYGKRGGMG